MPESRIQEWVDFLQTLAKMGGQLEQTKIVPNVEVMDIAPANLPAGYILVRNEDGYYIPAVVISGLTVAVGDRVNLLYITGTEAIVLSQATGSSAYGSGHIIQDESVSLTQRKYLNFVGPGVTAVDDAGNNQTDVTIPGAAGAWPYDKVLTVDPTNANANFVTIALAAVAAAANDLILVGNVATYAEATISLAANVSLAFFDNWNVLLTNTTDDDLLICAGENNLDRVNLRTQLSLATAVYCVRNTGGDTVVLNECRIYARNTDGGGAADAYAVQATTGIVEGHDSYLYANGTVGYALRALYVELYDCELIGTGYGLYVEAAGEADVYGGFLEGGTKGLYVSAGATVRLHNLPRIEGGITNLGTIEGAWIDENGDIIYGGTTTPVLKAFGSNVPDLGVYATAAERWGNIYQANAKDIYPRGDMRGLATRWINPLNLALTDEFHFRTGVIPTGYAWLNDGTFSGAPTGLDYAASTEYLQGRASGAGNRHFMQIAVTNAAASWQNKNVYGRFTTGLTTEMGLRLDIGDDTEYAEIYSDGLAADGTISITFRYRLNSGGVTTVASNVLLPAGDFQGLLLKCYWSGAAYSYIGYLIGGAGSLVNVTGFLALATPGAIPCAGRVGLFIKNTGNNAYCDWFWNIFT